MRPAQSINVGAWFLVGLNLLMALGSIWVFMRMAPAIAVIIDRNQRSLHACEIMLASIALVSGSQAGEASLTAAFETALEQARGNITESREPDALAVISDRYQAAFQGDAAALRETIDAITHLGDINRAAMAEADRRAQQFGSAGAWGIVFMAVGVFVVGMIFMRTLTRNLVRPLEEIHSVMAAHRRGDIHRRCTGADLPWDIQQIYNGVNEFLDRARL